MVTTTQVLPVVTTTPIIQPIQGQEDYGIVQKPIPYPTPKDTYIFSDEAVSSRTKFSCHKQPVGTSNWVTFHQSIQGEFFDKTFSADDRKSLYGLERNTDDYDAGKLEYFQTVKWKRLSYAYQDVQVFKQGVSNKDIYQGSLGNCYLLSVMSSIAEFPDRIERLFQQKLRSPKAAYCVNLCITGVFEEYYLDDMVPTKNNKVAFCHSDQGELWAILLEKAYAKAYGGYWNTGAGGFSPNTLTDLTGAPCEDLRWEDENERLSLFDKLFDADKKRYIMNTGTKGSGEVKDATGIISGHAYTLVGAYKLDNGDKVLKLRNPWGSGEWTGDYSDNSSKWTPQLKKMLEWSEADDGIFFMKVEDFMEYFENVAICHYRDDYFLSSLKDFNPKNTFACYQMNIEIEGDYYFGLSQPDKNHFDTGHTYAMMSIVVARQNGGVLEYVGGKGYPQRDIWFMSKCKPGKYVAFVSTNWDNANTDDFSIWTYGPKAIGIERVIKPENLKKVPDMLAQTIMSYVRID